MGDDGVARRGEAWMRQKRRYQAVARGVLAGLTQREIGQQVGIGQPTVSRIMQHPSFIELVAEQAELAGATPDVLGRVLHEALNATRQVTVGDGKGMTHIEEYPDHMTRLRAFELTVNAVHAAEQARLPAEQRDPLLSPEQMGAMSYQELIVYVMRRREIAAGG